MENISNIFLNKKILIYGLGKSGLSTFNFLKNKSEVFLYDDFQKKIKNRYLKSYLISQKKIPELKFDKIILSPGIDINKCNLTKFLKKNFEKIYTDFDIFYSFYKNDCITITGTNGKSTTCQLLFETLNGQKTDVRLAGNIGNPILSIKNIKKKTIIVIEASSYQLEYSKIFRSKYAVILNLSPDHIERHKTMNNYVKAKFKLLQNQLKGNFAFVKKNDILISQALKKKKFKSKIIKVDILKVKKFLKNTKNDYFLTETNKENLSFILEISKKLNLKKNLLKKTIKNFRGLKYRQQIIFKNNKITIINDSKSTSFSSSKGILKTSQKIFWLLGGVPKKGDKFLLPKKYLNNIKAFIYGKNKKFFINQLKNKVDYKNFKDMRSALREIISTIKNDKRTNKTLLFSPSAASFDEFKNFEERGFYFNRLIKKYLHVL